MGLDDSLNVDQKPAARESSIANEEGGVNIVDTTTQAVAITSKIVKCFTKISDQRERVSTPERQLVLVGGRSRPVKLLTLAAAVFAGLIGVAVADEPTRRDSDISRESGRTNSETVGPFVDLFADGDLEEHFETTGNWTLSEDRVAHLQPREGETDWKRYDAYLWLKKPYKDFECQFEYKHEKRGNSGFYFNVTDRQRAVGSVIEVQIRDSADEPELSAHGICGGILPGITPTANAAKPAQQWNQMSVMSLDGEITVKLNGVLVNKAKLTHPPLTAKPKQGFIGFQDHGIPFWLRNVRIRDLSTSTNDRRARRSKDAALETERRPNVILILSDDMGYPDLPKFGKSEIPTPAIDRLAGEGTLFTDAYVTAPICVASRMGLLTGQYQQRFGIYDNIYGEEKV